MSELHRGRRARSRRIGRAVGAGRATADAAEAATPRRRPGRGDGRRCAGITPPRRRGGAARFISDVDRRARLPPAGARRRRRRGGQGHRPLARGGPAPSPARSSADQLARATAERFGLDHVDLTVYKPDLAAVNLLTAAGRAPLQRGADRLRLDRHAARRDGGPVERPRARRPEADDGLRDPPGGRLAPRTSRSLIAKMNRLDDAVAEAIERGRGRGRRRRRRHPRVGRRRAGHQARQLDHRPGGRGRRLGHPLRAATAATCACASASTACSHETHHDPAPHGRRASSRA